MHFHSAKLALTAAIIAVVAQFPAEAAKLQKHKNKIDGEYLVVLDPTVKPKTKQVAHDLVKAHGGKVRDVWEHALQGFSATLPDEAAAEALGADPRVVSIEENFIEIDAVQQSCCGGCVPTTTQSLCADGKVPWQKDRIDQWALPLNNKYRYCPLYDGSGIDAYVIDTGIRDHADFKGDDGLSRLKPGYVAASNGGTADDCYSHGTHVASFLGGRLGGIAPGVSLIPVRVSHDCSGNFHADKVVAGMNWVAADHVSGPAVANVSLRMSASYAVDTAAWGMVNDRIFVTVGAGNEGYNWACGFSPQKVPGVLTVGATSKTDVKKGSYGGCIGVHAPGEGVGGASWAGFNEYNCNPGWNLTSMSAPLVAGLGALILDRDPYLLPSEVKAIIIETSTKDVIVGMPAGTPNRLINTSAILDECQTGSICCGPSYCPIPPADH